MDGKPTIKAHFAKDLHTCSITIEQGKVTATYHDLPVKKRNLRDWEEPKMLYLVKIPCAAALGKDYMVAFGRDAIFGYKDPEWTELVFHELDETEDHSPKQLGLFGGNDK
jgi:hypothetical protein